MESPIPFPEPTVTRDGPLGWAEPAVNFYLESTRDVASSGRATINDWYSRFPDSDGKFCARLRSRKRTDHEVALDELFTHEKLLESAVLSYEEDGRGPDFRLYRGSNYLAGIEVLSLFMKQDWSDGQARHGRIADELNKRIPLDRWFVGFEIAQLDGQPSIGKLAAWVKKTIQALPASTDTDRRVMTATYVVDGIRLDFTFIPRNPAPAKAGDRITAPGPIIGGWVRSAKRLQVALTDKAGARYDLRERPFAICVGVHDPFCSLDQIEDAIYGTEQYEVSTMKHSRVNGFFGRTPKCPDGKNRRVSCIYTIHNLAPWRPEEVRICRLDNPFASHPFPEDLLYTHFRVKRIDRDGRGYVFDWVPHRPADIW